MAKRYHKLFFTQEQELACELEQIIAEHGSRRALEYLDDAGALECPTDTTDDPPWGSADDLYEGPLYAGGNTLVLNHNPNLPYVGVTEIEEV